VIERGWLLATLALFWALELALPRRTPIQERGLRWPTNLTIGLVNILLTTVALAPLAVAAAAGDFRWAVLNQLKVSGALAIVIAIVALDALSYLQHRLLHANAMLWRIHRVHHADVDVDATTGLRFHPIEAVIGQATLAAGIVVLGLPAAGVAIYLWLSAVDTILCHANVRFPARLERIAAWIFVTPALHAIHHSTRMGEFDRNFAGLLSVWDRLGSTYRPEAHGGQANLRVGLAEFREPRYLTLPWTLALPFCAASSGPGALLSRR
jgi:sterol desaturase/sphingolipid hydroxylase (fatty acid hydroxylase superfamily)